MMKKIKCVFEGMVLIALLSAKSAAGGREIGPVPSGGWLSAAGVSYVRANGPGPEPLPGMPAEAGPGERSSGSDLAAGRYGLPLRTEELAGHGEVVSCSGGGALGARAFYYTGPAARIEDGDLLLSVFAGFYVCALSPQGNPHRQPIPPAPGDAFMVWKENVFTTRKAVAVFRKLHGGAYSAEARLPLERFLSARERAELAAGGPVGLSLRLFVGLGRSACFDPDPEEYLVTGNYYTLKLSLLSPGSAARILSFSQTR